MSTPPAAVPVTLVVSDVHLGAVPRATEDAFVDFVAFAVDVAEALVLNGDIFDVWLASRRFVPGRYGRVLSSLREATRRGLAISFVGGNRDAVEWGGDVLARESGARILPDPVRVAIAGRSALVAHGDGARWGASRPYTKPYPLLRQRAFVGAVRTLLPQEWLFRTLSARSPTHRRVAAFAAGRSTGPKRRAAQIEAWARAELERDESLGIVLAGHSHSPALVQVAPGRYYVNTGDWIEHHTYAVVPHAGAPEIRRWPTRDLVLRV